MRILVVRHGAAGDPDPERWRDDAQRPLTTKGVRRFAQIAERLAAATSPVDAITTSPYVRARQTAEILAERSGWRPLLVEPGLASGASPEGIAELLARLAFDSVCLVGHEPDLGRFVSWSIGASSWVRLRKGGAALLEGHDLREGSAELSWLVTPRALLGD